MKKVYQIAEFGTIRRESDYPGTENTLKHCAIPDVAFEQLCEFIAESAKEEQTDRAFELVKRKGTKLIRVGNYIGIVETKSGVVLEVLPKISSSAIDESGKIEEAKEVCLRMLRCLRDTPFITISDAQLSSKRNFHLLEVFIRTYIDEVDRVLMSGLVGGYERRSEVLNYVKGKINVPAQIRGGNVNQAQFNCTFKKFEIDNAFNKAVKATLHFLQGRSQNYNNRKRILGQLRDFESVELVSNPMQTVQHAKSQENRLTRKYHQLLEWSEIFLGGKAFTSFQGSSMNTSVLYPMERVFEDYVAMQFRKYAEGFRVLTQGRKGYYLVTQGDKKKFQLKPDIITEKPKVKNFALIDTKWKLLDQGKSSGNFGIPISDMYQLFAYGNKFRNEDGTIPKLILLYPKTEKFDSELERFDYDPEMSLRVVPFDLSLRSDNELQIRQLISA